MKGYTRRDDIIVITDEAHRTQYGTLALNMRNALPNASFIGFTGTPLFKDDEITKKSLAIMFPPMILRGRWKIRRPCRFIMTRGVRHWG